jgi:hypothetical protein
LKSLYRYLSFWRKGFQVIFNTYKNNEKIIPSAMWQKHRQVCGFLFAYGNASDCFYDGEIPIFSLQFTELIHI